MRVTVVEGTVEEIRAAFPDLVASGAAVSADEPVAAVEADKAAEENEMRTWLKARRNPKVEKHVESLIDGLIEDGFVYVLGPSRNTEDGKADYLRFYPQGPKRVGALVYIYPRTGRVDFRAMDVSFKDSDPEWAQHVVENPVADTNPYKTMVKVAGESTAKVARAVANYLREQDAAPSEA